MALFKKTQKNSVYNTIKATFKVGEDNRKVKKTTKKTHNVSCFEAHLDSKM